MSVTVRILGEVTVERSDAAPARLAPTLRVLLAVLAAQRGSVVSVSRLREVLWGEEEPAAAAATLQSHLSRLRRLLYPEGEIVARGGGYCLELSAGVVDAEEFMRLTDEARGLAEPGDAARAYAAALAWWRGPAFGELADHDGIRAEAVRLEELRHNAVEQWIECRCGGRG